MKKKTRKQIDHVTRRQIYQAKRARRKAYIQRFVTPVFSVKYDDLKAPPIFNLQWENCVEVIKYINNIKKFAELRKNITVNLSRVTEIREGAIAMLLSVMKEAAKRGIGINGTEPINPKAKEVLEHSGFFKFVRRSYKAESIKSKNLMRIGKKGTSHEFLGAEIRKAMDTVWGKEGRNPLVHTVAFEMMRNSCDHAFQKTERTWWHLSISHDEDKHSVKFSFVDNGKGIIKTLGGKGLGKFFRQFTGSSDILSTAFKGEIESRTGLPWRGKGLPTIFENFNDGYIKNFLVISNNAFIHFDRGIFKTLPISYDGTYYYWEVDKSCVKAVYN